MSSQAFVDRYESDGVDFDTAPGQGDRGPGLRSDPSQGGRGLAWMGFEARSAILEVLDQAIADKKAQVRVVAYDLSEPEVVSRLEKLKRRLKVIIDDSKDHGEPESGETAGGEATRRSRPARTT